MLDGARRDGYALTAVNVTSSETLNAAMRGFAEAEADGIVQITVGAAGYLSGSAVNDAVSGANALAALGRELAEHYPVLIALHTDHCPPDELDSFLRPLLAESEARKTQGQEPLFNSHMFDGSTLPLAENDHGGSVAGRRGAWHWRARSLHAGRHVRQRPWTLCAGVVKVNVDTDMQYAFTRVVADHVPTHNAGTLKVDGGVGDKAAYDPRSWGRAAEAAMADAVAQMCALLGSAGHRRALRFCRRRVGR